MVPSAPTRTLRLILALSLAACSSMHGIPASTSPYFVPNRHDLKRYQALAREQDSMLAQCSQPHSCVLTHFTRALVALYENRKVAAQHFQQVVAAAPRGHLASSSRFWLGRLQDPLAEPGQDGPFARATERLIRDLLDREIRIHQLTKQISARDKKVEQLTNLLEALKKIDQEMKERSRLPKPSTDSSPPLTKDDPP
jgi:TolA-binding protein